MLAWTDASTLPFRPHFGDQMSSSTSCKPVIASNDGFSPDCAWRSPSFCGVSQRCLASIETPTDLWGGSNPFLSKLFETQPCLSADFLSDIVESEACTPDIKLDRLFSQFVIQSPPRLIDPEVLLLQRSLQQAMQNVSVQHRFRSGSGHPDKRLQDRFPRTRHRIGDRSHGEHDIGVVDDEAFRVLEADENRLFRSFILERRRNDIDEIACYCQRRRGRVTYQSAGEDLPIFP